MEIENTWTAPIVLEYSHPDDVIRSALEIPKGPELPYVENFEEVVLNERATRIRKVLQPGEKLLLSKVNIWRYHQLPNPLPESLRYDIYVDLPQFGDVPAGVGWMDSLELNNPLRKSVLEAALSEQTR